MSFIESSLIVDGLDIQALSDEELYQKLIENGVVAGPITECTRKIYERKLAVVMGGEVANFSQTIDSSQLLAEGEEEDVQPNQAYIDYLAAGESRLRRRVEKVYDELPVEESEDENDGTAPIEPSAAYVSYSSNTSMSAREASRIADCEEQEGEGRGLRGEEEEGFGYSTLLYIAGLVAVAVALYAWLSSGEEDTFKKLENMAKAQQQRREGHA